MYKQLAKPLLFQLEPEKAHYFTVGLLKTALKFPLGKQLIEAIYQFEHKNIEREVMGLSFKNPIGIAAGFDKNADMITEMESIGFGFTEVGTVTPKAQAGNEQPRLFRLPSDKALINRMGFNNLGVEQMVRNLKKVKRKDIIIGGNIGKNKVTPNEQAVNDYIFSFNALFDYVDYFAVNVSSPNTPNLRALQDKDPLTNLLSQLQKVNLKHKNPKPILLKIAPDLNNNQLLDIVEIIKATKLAGVIATNTTIDRNNLNSPQTLVEQIGGLSGEPVQQKSTAVIKLLRQKLGRDYVIIGVGGINSVQSALEKLDAGADLLQLYTGMVYEGPSLVKQINKAIAMR